MKNFFRNNPLPARILALSVLLVLLATAYNALVSLGYNFTDRVTVGEFFAKSRIIPVIIFALFGGLIIYFMKIRAWVRVAIMSLSFLLFGILPALERAHCFFNLSSPLCAFLKPLLFISQGSRNIPIKFFIFFAVIIALALLGKNIFCGWACPIGAMQEISHFSFRKIQKRRVPFRISMAVRTSIFILSIMLLFMAGINLYFDYLNPFAVLSLRFSLDSDFLISLAVFLLVFAASMFVYRPYCYFICPIGLITWIIGFFSVFRIRCDEKKCTNCLTCIAETSCPAIESIVNGKTVVPDCYCCDQCVVVCPENALSFTAR